MTEEIIIDGVNVSECVSFDKCNGHNICCYDDTREDKIPFANFCVENKNCYYKQLKRLEQERDDLQLRKDKYYQQTLDDAITISDLITKCNDLEQENKELKSLNKKICEDWEKEIKVYWNALEEIKEVCKMDCGDCEYNQDCECNFEECEEAKIDDILNKINEVLNEVDR